MFMLINLRSYMLPSNINHALKRMLHLPNVDGYHLRDNANYTICLANARDGSPTSGAGEAARGCTEPAAGEDSRTLSGPGVGGGVAVEDPGA